jgi:hypothetical protein
MQTYIFQKHFMFVGYQEKNIFMRSGNENSMGDNYNTNKENISFDVRVTSH